jgi:hypothetical protein
MTVEMTVRVVAEIYRGIDFPDDWVSRSTAITAAMGKELLVSVIAFLDQEKQPVAVCWQTAEGVEKFARLRFDDSADASVLDGLESDLARLDRRLGLPAGLLGTFLWDPPLVPRSQAEPIFKQAFSSGRYSSTVEWNKAPREIFDRANDLIVMVRSVESGSLSTLPTNAEDMRDEPETTGAETFLILPVRKGEIDKEAVKPVGSPHIAFLFGAAMLIAIALISAYLAGEV